MKIEYNKIYIAGPQHCGKGLVRQIFDGHPELSNMFIQGATFSVFYDFDRFAKKNNINNIKSDTINVKFNDNTNYNLTPENIILFLKKNDKIFQQLPNYIKKKKIVTKNIFENDNNILDFNFNFDGFVSDIKKNLINSKKVNLEDIQDIIYYSFFTNWKNNNSPHKLSIIQSATTDLFAVKSMFDFTKRTKIIFLSRDPISIMFTNSKHYIKDKNPKMYESKNFYNSKYFKKIFFSYSLIKKIDDYNKLKNTLKKNYPGRIHLASFEEFVNAEINNVNQIANNLGLKNFKDKIFLSINSHKLKNQKFLYEEQDNYRMFLNQEFINYAKKFINHNYFFQFRKIIEISSNFFKNILRFKS